MIGRSRENRRSGCMSPSKGDVRRADTGRHWVGQRAKLLSPAGSSLGGSDGPGLEAAVVQRFPTVPRLHLPFARSPWLSQGAWWRRRDIAAIRLVEGGSGSTPSTSCGAKVSRGCW